MVKKSGCLGLKQARQSVSDVGEAKHPLRGFKIQGELAKDNEDGTKKR